MRYWTKKQTLEIFYQDIVPSLKEIEKEQGSRGVDVSLRRETWNNFIDALITDKQVPPRAEDWNCPW